MDTHQHNVASRHASADPARILLVVKEGEIAAAVIAAMNGERFAIEHCSTASQAGSALLARPFDIVLLDPSLGDSDSFEIARLSQRLGTVVKVVMISTRSSFERAVEAMRCGAVDYVKVPFEREDFLRRIAAAIGKGRLDQEREERLARLKKICRKLNTARHEISEQVDVLCDDLAAAYRDLTDQVQEVATSSEFKTLIRQELDVESLLRTALEYLLAKTGPTNAAVFLPGPNAEWNLGAYVNYDCPRETASVLLDHLGQQLCPVMSDEADIVRFDDADDFGAWIGVDPAFLSGSQVISFSCMHDEECMAIVVLFRKPSEPFKDELAALLDLLRDLFADQLATVIRVHHRASESWPEEAVDDDAEFDGDCGYGGLAA
jgi:DNA-binding response OmpR family regulator